MKPFRKNVAIAIDGGGLRGVVITRALMMLEDLLGKPSDQIFHLTAGTSTGSIISAGIASGMTAREMYQLYMDLGPEIFAPTWRSRFWPLTRSRYTGKALQKALEKHIGSLSLGELWKRDPQIDVVITAFDLKENRNRFIKPWKGEYQDWSLTKAVLASSTVPTYFPAVDGRFVDGGVGSYSNPCYLAAYELQYCLNWDPTETTLISLGTGRSPHELNTEQVQKFYAWNWIGPVLGAFQQSADDQQVHLVSKFFNDLDFRRFQVNLSQPIAMDDVKMMPRLAVYGDELGRMLVTDHVDSSALRLPHSP